MRDSVPELADASFNWMFVADYQSTEESQWDEVETEVEGGKTSVKKLVKSSLPWQSRPPTYRSAQVSRVCSFSYEF